MLGAQYLNSKTQLLNVVNGTTIINGPIFFLNSIKYANKEIVYMVLPKPISSAKTFN